MKRIPFLLQLGLVLVFGFAVKEAECYKILMVFPSFGQSHVIVASGLLKGLAKKGHEVTMVSCYPLSKPMKNYRDVVIPMENIDKDAMMSDMVKNPGNQMEHFKKMPQILQAFYDVSNSTMSNPQFRKIMEEETFDLVIVGIFANLFFSGLAYHFNCPLVVMTQVQTMHLTSQLVGTPLSPAETAHATLGYREPMTFGQRVKNFIVCGVDILIGKYFRYKDRIYYDSNFPADKYPSFDETLKNVSLVLINHHFSQGAVRPYAPGMVEIGGIHIDEKTDPLPKNIQEFLDSANDGAIFFAFGSNVKSSILPQEKIDAILRTFGRLKEKVLFKWENDNLPNKPDNMMIGKWMPQRDILAHKNIKLFVSHGGMGSLAEAKYRGVPVVGVPFFGDQMGNVAAAAEEGWAYQLNFEDLTEESFLAAVKEVLSNEGYKTVAESNALLYKDRPMSALETANFWIEYVIRHKGARHMQSHAVHLNFWQINSIDVIAFLLLIVLVIFKVFILTAKCCCRRVKKKLFSEKQKKLLGTCKSSKLRQIGGDLAQTTQVRGNKKQVSASRKYTLIDQRDSQHNSIFRAVFQNSSQLIFAQIHYEGRMIRIIVVLCTFLAFLATQSHGAKILLAFPTPSKSHMIVASSLMKGLAAKGHKVTVMSSFPEEKPLDNYRDIVVKGDDAIKEYMKDVAKDGGSSTAFFARFTEIIDKSLASANQSFNEEVWQKVMREESFDLVVYGMFFNNFVIGLGDHFKCPVIGIFSGGVTEMMNQISGNPSAVASVPHLFFGKVPEMTFMIRLKTFLFNGVERLLWHYVNYKEKQYYDYNFPSSKYKSYEEMQKNITLFFANDHFSAGTPRPTVPGVIEVGGLHLKSKPDPLPPKIQEFLDGAEHGVVFFSLGSNVKSSFLAPEKLDAILKTFAKLKQRVLFKWETDSLPNQPKNVMTQKWMPQADILAHKNVKVFVSHAGLGGITEAKYHGVPIVGIPFFADQMTNIATAEREGWAVTVELKSLSEETFTKAISEVVNNPKYRNTVQGISSLFRDRPMTAMETAVFWAEYVIRHRGAPHMQSHAVHLNFIQRNSIDVIAFLAIVITILFTSVAYCCCFCCRKLTKSTGSAPRKSKKKSKAE
ncbi:uncharacterized protein LOC132259183 [Phlebotomus argentipes]|uniref:uncharacterized protein LOC132259183 n=1 Tax=Phlebotomus argentipes TaxID=94469 RepID=UPI002892C05C|nr:uncharacterized protein LOC132259183 [Phlebotomus argentipes]